MKPLFRPTNQAAIDEFIASPSHALIIEGSAGAGKGNTAVFLAQNLLNIDAKTIAHYPFFSHFTSDELTIGIEDIRNFQQFMRLKTVGNEPIRRILIVENAHRLTTEAQNAFLKLLEEPPADTVIIMTALSDVKLLPTIYSRAQKISLVAPAPAQLKKHFENNGFSSIEIDKAQNLSGGQIGLMTALLNNDDEHSLRNNIEIAKQIISADIFNRLAMIDKLAKQKGNLPDLLYAMQKIYKAVMTQAGNKNNVQQVKRANHALAKIVSTADNIKYNPNPKLLLTDLFLNI